MLLLVLLIFIGSAVGVLNISIQSSGWISLNPGLLFDSPVTGTAEFINLAATGLLLLLLLPWLDPVKGSILAILCAVPPVYINISNPGAIPLLPMEFSLLTILVIFSLNVLISLFEETRQKQQIMNVFGRYIPPQLVDDLSRQPELAGLEGESKVLTVMFADLQDFTGVAEQMNSKQLVRLLNDYFTIMTAILHAHGATIDKYIGDSIMTFWGAPLPSPDHARLAVLAAMKMQEALIPLSADNVKHGWPQLNMGIGINTGVMNVGNMGSKFRISYTVLGDHVNLASRIETLTRVYQVPIIVGENTVREIDDIVFRELDLVQVRGKHKPNRIFQPLCLKSALTAKLQEQIKLHNRAISAYHARQLEEARQLFRQLMEQDSNDSYYKVMLQNISDKLKQQRAAD